jgi:hypothetical protein
MHGRPKRLGHYVLGICPVSLFIMANHVDDWL